jgi:hypothetical protein
MFRIQWLSESLIWHTDHACNNERAAISAAMHLARSGRYRAVRVTTRDGVVVFSS